MEQGWTWATLALPLAWRAAATQTLGDPDPGLAWRDPGPGGAQGAARARAGDLTTRRPRATPDERATPA